MNILLLAPQPFYQERGTPIAVRLLARTLGEMGHVVHLLVFAEGDEVTIPGVTIHRHIALPGMSNIKPGFSLKKLVCDFLMSVKCVQLVRKHDFHLVHAVEESVFMAVAVKKLFGIPYVYDMDSCMSGQLTDKYTALKLVAGPMQWLEKMAISRSRGVLTVCRALEDTVKQMVPEKLTVRLEDISLLEDTVQGQENLREKLGIEDIMLLYVGNLERYQGIDLLLEAFKEAVGRKEGLCLVLIGGTAEDIEKYREKAKQLAIGSKVFFCGPRPVTMLGYYLGQADILVSPRTQGNNTPMKIYSYLDSGVPVLATDLPTHTQVLDGDIACLVRPEPVDMAKEIVALAEDGEKRKKIGFQARQRVHDEYSLQAYRRKLATFYQQVEP